MTSNVSTSSRGDTPLNTVSAKTRSNSRWPNPEASVGEREYQSLGNINRYWSRCWQATGEVRRIFDEHLGTQIKEYIRENSDPVPAGVTWSIYMVGRSKDKSEPTIIISGGKEGDRGKKVRELIRDSPLLSGYPGIKTAYRREPPDLGHYKALAAEGMAADIRAGEAPQQPAVFCKPWGQTFGKQIFISQDLQAPLRQATAGGLLRCGEKYYYLTAAHAFLEDTEKAEVDPTMSDCDDEFDMDGVSSVGDLNEQQADYTSRGSTTPESVRSTNTSTSGKRTTSNSLPESLPLFPHTSQTLPASREQSQLFIEGTVPTPAPKPLDTSSPIHTQSGLIRLGEMVYSSHNGPHSSLDYALIEVSVTSLLTFNEIPILDGTGTFLYPNRVVDTGPKDTDIVTVTGSAGFLRGRLSGTKSFRVGSAKGIIQELWTVELFGTLADGDCGSWVVDAQSGDVYGHIVAGNTESGFAYVVPACQVYNDIWKYFSDQVELSTISSHCRQLGSVPSVDPRHYARLLEGTDIERRMHKWHDSMQNKNNDRENASITHGSHKTSSRQLPPGGMHTPILPKAGFDLEGIPPKLIVIGVDFGTTYTGVAFSTLDWPEPRVINNWPSPRRIHVENKVPTSVAYRAGRKRINWGFECPAPAEIRPGMAVWDTFKLFLDPLFLKEVCDHCKDEDLDFMPTNEDVQMWFEDFLTELYQYIVAYITKYFQLKDWEAARVVYSFSVPAIWSSRIEVVKTFEDIIRKAGFGKSKQHIVKIELTEAEAAAVYTARSWKDHYAVAQPGKPLEEAAGIRQGSVLVVCDAGGGTTDTSVLKVNSIKPFRDSNGNEEVIAGLEQLDSVEGKATGSVQIDEAFQREVERRLRLILHADNYELEYATKDMLNRSLEEAADSQRNNRLGWGNNTAKDVIKSMAEDMTKSRRGMSFQHLKKIFGTKLFTDNIKVQLPDLFKNFNYPEVGVEGGRMTFTYDDIKAMFDEQVYSIFKLIDDQLERLRKIDPSQQVSHFVISGGLGSSKYVQDCIMRRFGPIPGGHRIEILVARDPQLSVCKGLVIDHIYSVNYANFILSTMCSRVSYGILFNEPYNKIQHPGPPYKGPVDRKDYGLNQIRWLVRAGKPIRRDKPISRTFYRIADPKIERTIICSDTIVSSSAPVDYLPRSINEGGAVRAYQIKSKLDLNALKQEDYVERQQRMKFLGLKAKSYWEIEHTILVYTGVADLRFQIRVGKNVIGEASLIPIIWMHERDARQDGVVSGEEMEDEDSKLFEIQDEQEQIKLRALPRTW